VKVKIKNFMCHEALEVELTALNIISGENGGGKSAIFHAINWCINGGTNNFITKGEKESSVTIEVDNNTIVRTATKSKTSVTYNEKIVCTTKDSLKELNINLPIKFYSQFEKLFLLHETGKHRADILNEMFDTEKIENGLLNINQDIRKENTELKTLKTNFDVLESKLKTVTETKQDMDNLVSKHKKLTDIKTLLESYKDIKIKELPEKITLKIETDIKTLLENYKDIKIKKLPEKITLKIETDIKTLLENYKDNEIEPTETWKEKLAKITKELVGTVCPTCSQKIKEVF